MSAKEGCLPRRVGCLPRGWGVYLVGCLPSRGVCPGGVFEWGGCLHGGVYVGGVSTWGCLPRGGVCLTVCTPPAPVNRMTDRCKNITLPQTLFVGGKNKMQFYTITVYA